MFALWDINKQQYVSAMGNNTIQVFVSIEELINYYYLGRLYLMESHLQIMEVDIIPSGGFICDETPH